MRDSYQITFAKMKSINPKALAFCVLLLVSGLQLTAGIWTPAGLMNANRREHTSTLLQNGKVLVTGGYDANVSATTSACDLYDPYSNTYTAVGPMATARKAHAAVKLTNG